MLKLLALDIDGTLMPEGATAIEPEVFALMHEVMQAGVQCITCSGRQYANQRRLFAPIADELEYICENGSLTISGGEVLTCTVLDREKVCDLMRAILTQDGCEALLSTPRTCFVQPKSEKYLHYIRDIIGNDIEVTDDLCSVEEDFIKISAYYPEDDFEAMQKRLEEFSLPYQRAVSGGNRWIDFLIDGSNKGIALRKYCEIKGIAKEECVAIGDNENDMALAGMAGQLWAMESGKPALKAIADRVIRSVPEELNRIIKNR